ncbi:MAG: prolipoprotein diacylglyceryl transferase [Erysipelotrichaceae bacterium]|nr:prolipoprotein diacylglyceryl transferase [Erysipelotrichaceae bacterium]
MYQYFFLTGDILLVLMMTFINNKYYKLPKWKIVSFSLGIVPIGYFCGKLMRLVEANTWSGVSFYGAVLFAPILMVLFGLLLKIKPLDMLDMCAPAGCIALVFMKIQCKITGCCYGKILRYEPNGRPVRFPSQIVEMIFGIILLIIIMMIIQSKKEKGYVYAWFLLLYGASRFVLNLFRDTEPFVLNLSAGCFWSIISVIIGGTVLYLKKVKEKRYVKK